MIKQSAYLLIAISIAASCQTKQSNTAYIDTNIGNVGLLLEPTRPTVHLPNQMVRMYPVRKDYIDDQISWFPMSILSHRQGELFGIKPIAGTLTEESWNHKLAYDHDLEKKSPWHYSAWLPVDEIQVSFAPSARSGMYLFEFTDDGFSLLFRSFHSGAIKVNEDGSLEGQEQFMGMKAFFYGVFQKNGNVKKAEVENLSSVGRAWISFENATQKTLAFKYGFSFISTEQAKQNLEKEIPAWDFDALKNAGQAVWEKEIGQIQVKGGTDAQRRTFFTSFYRTKERMIDMNEYGKYYSAYDHQVHESAEPFYADDWVWDTYLTHHPLRMILDPKQEADMLQSYTTMYDQSGWMPQFPITFGDNPAMNGFHSTIVFLDAWRKGVRAFDQELAYKGMRKNATSATMLPWINGPACSLDTFYYQHGYYPALYPGQTESVERVQDFEKRQSVAITLGHSYDDWALAQMAKELGNENDYALFLPKSKNYKNLYRADKGLMWPKDSAGNWIPIDPKFDGGPGGRDYYDENNAYTYAWQVQHDIPGLVELMGGKAGFEKKLDQLFREDLGRSKYHFWAKFPDATGIVGQFNMGNEPSFHIPYLFNFTESPWKTQQKIRFLLDTWYKDNIFGIPGDEDGGGMTSFVVFSMMGFYPITPGLPGYTIGSPVFEEVTIDLANDKKFTVIAQDASPENKYIQTAEFNGKVMEIPWFSHEDLMDGGTLKVQMGPKPNKQLWKNADLGFLYK